MTVSAPVAPPARRAHRWRALLFAPSEGPTRRRGSDAVRLVVAALTVLMCELVVRTNSHAEISIEQFLHPPPSGVQWLVTLVWYAGSLGMIAVLVLFGLLFGKRALARDTALAGLAAWGVCGLLALAAGVTGGRPEDPLLVGINQGFPLARIAATIAVATAARPYLSRGLQRLLYLVIALVSLATVVNGAGLPINVIASLAVGWGVTAALRLIFGSPLGLPSAEEVGSALAELGLVVTDVEPASRQVWGVARYRCRRQDGRRLDVSIYGRDAADAQVLAKLWRSLFYRDSGATLALTRIQQVEHEAYLTLLAGRAGVRVADVVAAATAGASRDAVLATLPPPGTRLADADPSIVSDRAIGEVLRELLRLREARIAHGALNPRTIVVDASGPCGFVDFRRASSSAPADRLDRDTACVLATLASAVGAERVVEAARRVLPTDVLVASLPHLQSAALDSELSRSLHAARALLRELRTRAAEAAGVEPPKLAEPRRIGWASTIFAVGTLIGGWALIGVLVNVGNSFDTIIGARWGWVICVFLLSQAVYLATALATIGSVTEALVFSRVVLLEVGNSFTALAVGTVGVLAARVRFFQTQGLPAAEAVSSGVLESTASWIVKGALFLIALPIGWGSLHLEEHPTEGKAGVVWLIVVVVLAAALGVGLVLLVPRLRRLARDKLRPKLADVLANLRQLAVRPLKVVEVIGGCLAAQLLVALALGASLHAFGEHLSLATILIVLTLASMIGGVSPVPGGMGVVEAGMILGLTSAGIPQSEAVAAVFVQRLFTAYLPPIWGWFVLAWMRRKEYL